MVAYVHACLVGTVAIRLLCPWDFPGRNTGVDCHYFSSGDLPNPGFRPESPGSPALAGGFFTIVPPEKSLL